MFAFLQHLCGKILHGAFNAINRALCNAQSTGTNNRSDTADRQNKCKKKISV